MLSLASFSRRRSSSSSTSSAAGCLSLSPVGWNPSRPTISPPSITNVATSPLSDSESDSSRPTSSSSNATLSSKRRSAPRSLSPPPSAFTTSSASPIHHACAFPSWPTTDSLTPPISTPSPTSSYFSPVKSLPSSRISDDDLMGLDFAPQAQHEEEAVAACISWSAVGTGAIAQQQTQVVERRRRLPPPPAQYRKRSSSRVPTRKSTPKKLGAIAE